MKSWSILLLLPLFLFACNENSEQTAAETPEPTAETQNAEATAQAPDAQAFSATYKADEGIDGGSDFLRIVMVGNEITELYLWSDIIPEPTQLEILTQEYHDSEEMAGITGEALWPGQAQPIAFGMIEDRINLTYPDDHFQEFYWVE